jgi:hypothetical protein
LIAYFHFDSLQHSFGSFLSGHLKSAATLVTSKSWAASGSALLRKFGKDNFYSLKLRQDPSDILPR